MDNVIELAHQAGGTCFDKDGSYGNYSAGSALFTPIELERFATLVRNAALEEAAVKCDELMAPEEFNRTEKTVWDVATLDCGAAIRNLKEPTP